jgi:ribonuclease P protein component
LLPPSAQSNKKIPKAFLKRRSDYLRTYKGRLVRAKLFTLYARRNEGISHRLGISAPRSVGTAVVRNKLKRWSREIYKKHVDIPLDSPIDINILFGNKNLKQKDFKNATFQEFQIQFKSSLRSLIKELG